LPAWPEAPCRVCREDWPGLKVCVCLKRNYE
jgi:hypothetical protein